MFMLGKGTKEKIKTGLDIYLAIIGLLTLVLFLIILGYELNAPQIKIIRITITIITISFVFQEFSRCFFQKDILKYLKLRWFENLLALILGIELFFPGAIINFINQANPKLSEMQATLIYIGLLHLIIIIALIVKILRFSYLLDKLKLHPGAIFALSFAFIIIFGTILLLLPNATPEGTKLSLIDSLFTSTSAVCVTGLIVVDTAKDFTFLGQLLILFLLQIGGLGVMTLTTFFAMYLSGGVSFKMRIMMRDLLSQESLVEVRKLILKILFFTVTIELVGAIILYHSLGGSFTEIRWDFMFSSIFHSVSAFCNAGFSIYSTGLMDSAVSMNYSYYSTIMLLIVLGGLGFTVLSNLTIIRPRKNNLKKLKHRISVSTKIVLSTTSILIISGTLIILIAEPFTFDSSMNVFEKIFHSLFLSITARTAGFNTVPTELLTNVAVVIILPLMWIGASPGSTGGGIKTTTISLAVLSLLNLMRGKDRVELFNREIEPGNIRKAFMVILSSLIFLGIGSFLLIWIEPDKQPLDLIFEATSALGTVGLSRNITGFLGTGGKAIVIILMYVGRIGVLTFFLAFIRTATQQRYTLAKTDIMIG
ncbi:MAG: potassium transporter TrkG [bacterium]